MGEKGGKAVPVPSSKPSLKSGSKTSGKEDGSTQSKKSKKKVQFDSDLSFSPSAAAGKANSPFSNVNLSNGGGKGEKTAKRAKGKEKNQRPELKLEQELPKNAQCLMDCEAREILQGIQDQMVVLSEDSSIKLPVSFDRGLQYAKTRPTYSDQESVKRVLGELKKFGVTEGEICVISNVCPENVNEVFALVPSLKPKKNKLMEPMKAALSELAKLKQST